MIITQTVEIPASRRIFLDLPRNLPTGKARVKLNVVLETELSGETSRPPKYLFGMHKDMDAAGAHDQPPMETPL